jgi:hypothetical protein
LETYLDGEHEDEVKAECDKYSKVVHIAVARRRKKERGGDGVKEL